MVDVRGEIRAARARRQRKTVVAASIVVLASVVLGLGALIASDALRLEGAPGPALAEHIATTTTQRRSDPAACRSGLTPDDPLRLWIGGDSLAGSLGPSLGGQAAATGVVQPVYDSRVSSGLTSPEFFDWPGHATEEMARLTPEIVVFIIGANDWKTPTGTSGGPGAWQAEYELQVEEMVAILEGEVEGRNVLWVGSPPMQDRRKDAGVREVNAVARRVVERHERATYVDAYDLFAGDDGAYTASLPGPNGRSVRVRAGDGVHLTDEGGDLLGAHVYEQLDARCGTAEQAVPSQPKPVLRTRGSDGPSSRPVGSSGSGASGSGGSGSTATTAPPAPPPPEPPAVEPPPEEPPPPPEEPPAEEEPPLPSVPEVPSP